MYLAGNDGKLLAHVLVGVEVAAQECVVLLDDDLAHHLHGLGANAAHPGGCLVKELALEIEALQERKYVFWNPTVMN